MAQDSDALSHALRVSSVVYDVAAAVAEATGPAESLAASLVYSIANGNHEGSVVNHWHANQAGTSPGLPIEASEVGGLTPVAGATETCRGFAEIDISELTESVSSATLKVRVRDVNDVTGVPVGGLFGQTTPYQGIIQVYLYSGNISSELADFDAVATLAGTFDTTAASAQDVIDCDITDGVNALIGSATAIGVQLRTLVEPEDEFTAITFYDVTLELAGGGNTNFAVHFTGDATLPQSLLVSTAGYRSADTVGSVSAWFKTTSTVLQEIISSADEATAGDSYFRIRLEFDGTISLVQRSSADTATLMQTVANGFNDGEWHLVVWTSDGLAYKCYVDGVAQTLTLALGADNGDWLGDTINRDNLIIGAYKDLTGVSAQFFGDIDEVAVWDVELSATSITELWNAGDGVLIADVDSGVVVLTGAETPVNGWACDSRNAGGVGKDVVGALDLTPQNQPNSAPPIKAGTRTKFTSAASGAWETETTWTPNGVPGDGDDVNIISGHDITVNGNTTIGASGASTTTAVKITSGTLTVASGVLTYRGKILLANSQTMTVNAGAGLKHDSSLSADPPNTIYKLALGTSHSAGAKLILNGTSGSHCTFTSETANSAAYGQIDSGFISGQVQATYADFSRLGSGNDANGAIYRPRPGTTAAGTEVYFDNCTFDQCGSITVSAAVAVNTVVRFLDVKWTNTINLTLQLTSAGSTGSVVTVDGCVFDKTPTFFTSDGMVVTDTYFHQGFTATVGADPMSITDSFLRDDVVDPISTHGGIADCIVFKDLNGVNPHFMATARTGFPDASISRVIGQFSSSNQSGDFVILGNIPDGGSDTIEDCLVLPNSTALASGTLVSQLGAANQTFAVNHNTVWNQGIAVGETYAGHTGMLTSAKSNLFHWPVFGVGNYKIDDSGADDSVVDLVAAVDADFNAGFNCATGDGGAGKGYVQLEFSSGNPGVNDIDDEDPQFVDSTRSIPTYDIDGLGNPVGTAWQTATGYNVGDIVSASNAGVWFGKTINFRCILAHTSNDGDATNGKPEDATSTAWRTNWEYATLYRLRSDTTLIQALHTWLRDGFAPTNPVYDGSAHDGGDIGAVSFVSA